LGSGSRLPVRTSVMADWIARFFFVKEVRLGSHITVCMSGYVWSC
jgi:hypothetical protein